MYIVKQGCGWLVMAIVLKQVHTRTSSVPPLDYLRCEWSGTYPKKKVGTGWNQIGKRRFTKWHGTNMCSQNFALSSGLFLACYVFSVLCSASVLYDAKWSSCVVSSIFDWWMIMFRSSQRKWILAHKFAPCTYNFLLQQDLVPIRCTDIGQRSCRTTN